MQFRHEVKHTIDRSDYITLCQRLNAVMRPDPYAGPDGTYAIHSLYFDTLSDRVLREKAEGMNRREKFRLRCYNGDLDHVRLEKKVKRDDLCGKEGVVLTRAQVEVCFPEDAPALLLELSVRMRSEGLLPRAIVDYVRRPYVCAAGNVRVTLDSEVRTGAYRTDFLRTDRPTVPARNAPLLLEVKWGAFLPDYVRTAVTLPGVRWAAFSKYAACRVYG